MSAVRGLCLMRKSLHSPEILDFMPSFLGSIFREAYYGIDNFNYENLATGTDDEKLKAWGECRTHMGMFTPLEDNNPDIPSSRQQYLNS
jgi:hypothetical protein